MGRKSIDDAMKEIEARCKKVAKSVVEEVQFEIQNKYLEVINIFYDNYWPRMYNRTYRTFQAADFVEWVIAGRRQVKNQIWYDEIPNNAGGVRAKIGRKDLPVKKMGDYKYKAMVVIDSSFIPGNPYRAKEGKDWVFGRTWQLGIHGFARHDNTDYVKDRLGKKAVVPRRMKHPPEELMQWRVNKLLTKKNLDSLYSAALIREFYS